MPIELTPEQWLKRLTDEHQRELEQLNNLNAHFEGTMALNYLHPELLAELDDRLQQVVINWPELVVDCLDERLTVEGFRVSGQGTADKDLAEIWQGNDLDEWSQQGHVEALVMRRAFTIAGTSAQTPDMPVITIESPLEMHAIHDPRTREIVAAAKWWEEKGADERKLQHATLYLPNDTLWWIREDGRWVEDPDHEPDHHELGTPPVSMLVNRPRLRCPGGKSELTSIIPISNAANKIATDMMVSAEFHSMPRRWALGFGAQDFQDDQGRKISTWSKVAGRIWASEKTRNEGAEVGQFPEADLQNFHRTLDKLGQIVASLGALPSQYLGFTTTNPASADAIRSSEARLVKRAERRQGGFGGGWERTMRIADRMRTGQWRADLRRLETQWRDASTPTIAQSADATVKTHQAGILPLKFARQALRYTDEQITLMEEQDRLEAQMDPVGEIARSLAGGQPDSPQQMDTDMIKQKAEALGILVRAGVDRDDAARRVGLEGIDFSEYYPVALRTPNVDRPVAGG